jgi:hypothetical protein
VGVGAGVVLVFGIILVGILGLVPFVSGLLDFSRRVVYASATIVACGLVFFDAYTSIERYRHYGTVYPNPFDAFFIAFGAAELLLVFLIAHWLGSRFRAAFIWLKDRLRNPSTH